MSKNKTENGNAKGFKRMVLKNTRFGTRESFVKKNDTIEETQQ